MIVHTQKEHALLAIRRYKKEINICFHAVRQNAIISSSSSPLEILQVRGDTTVRLREQRQTAPLTKNLPWSSYLRIERLQEVAESVFSRVGNVKEALKETRVSD